MKYTALVLMILSITLTMGQNSIYQYKFETLDGDTVSFSDFIGKKILIFNAASECGFTSQYEELQELHEKYKEKLVVIGFPANNFGQQEPGSNKEIASFCQKNYGVTFLMAAKISVAGEDIHPIFKWLCEQKNQNFTGAVKWNFEKFILDEQGVLITRFRSITTPMSKNVQKIVS